MKGRMRKGLIKKGAPLLGKPQFHFESSHMTKSAANKAEDVLLDKPTTVDTRQIRIPRQYAVYRQKSKPIRITPRTPRLR